MSADAGVVLRPVESDEADEISDRITTRAFGSSHDAAAYGRRRPERRGGRFYIGQLDGEDAGSGGAFDFAMRLPGGTDMAVSGITGVGVLPVHRRRGVLTALMARLLDDAAARGQAAAVLYASEGTIYPRFGFGPVSPRAFGRIVSGRSAFRSDTSVSPGRVRTVDVDDARQWQSAWAGVYERARERRPGELSRSDAAWGALLARREGKDDRLFLSREDAAGTVDGYAVYRISEQWRGTGPEHELHVHELVASSDGAELALWRSLFDHDLVALVSAEVPVDWLVPAVLVDPWSVRIRSNPHSMWARLLDVHSALAQRRYRCPGRLVLQVLDESRPSVAGTFRVEVDLTGSASCEPTDEPPDLVLGSDVLARLWLGGQPAARLVRAGLIRQHVAGAGELADLMFGWDPAPFTVHRF